MPDACDIIYYKDVLACSLMDFDVQVLDESNENWEEVSMSLPLYVDSLKSFILALSSHNFLYNGFDLTFSPSAPNKFTVFDPTNNPLFSGEVLLGLTRIELFAPMGR